MRAASKLIVGLAFLINALIGVGLFVTRPTAGPSFDPGTTPVQDLPAATEALVAPFASASYFDVSATSSENDRRWMKAHASDPREEEKLRAIARQAISTSQIVERGVRNAAIWVLVGLLVAPLGLGLVGMGLPKNGTVVVLLGAAAVAMPQSTTLLGALIPTVIAWLALLGVSAARRPAR